VQWRCDGRRGILNLRYGLIATLEMRSEVFISCALDVTIPGVVDGLEFYCTIKVKFAAWVKFVDPDVKLPVTAR
jgi:hypothetical protein